MSVGMPLSDTLLEHFRNPRNAGELADASHVVEVTNPVCGDVLRLSVRVDGRRFADVKFLCRGCTAAIACASLLTEQLKGSSTADSNRVTAEMLAQQLQLTPATLHAAQLAVDGLRALQKVVGTT